MTSIIVHAVVLMDTEDCNMIDFKWHEFDRAVDERIQQAMDIRNEYAGCGLFDDDGKLVDTGMYQLDKGTMLEIMQYQQEQITELHCEIKQIREKVYGMV
jgi:hypothetical protein